MFHSEFEDSPTSLSKTNAVSASIKANRLSICNILLPVAGALGSSKIIAGTLGPHICHHGQSETGFPPADPRASEQTLRPRGSVRITTFQPGASGHSEKKTCSTCEGNANESVPNSTILLKLAMVKPHLSFFIVADGPL
ncbi:hypothetical protein KC19_VG147800 [Ceratodon purpureus]|uniref:Uncharacterized protein n=1 Tax=Ceratodon purpureus TaxID=3225 RepID=A0A8T0HRB2_CERPU|nr:hypothetical protein KC19_VG147800 [Ceratodon purpureus]